VRQLAIRQRNAGRQAVSFPGMVWGGVEMPITRYSGHQKGNPAPYYTTRTKIAQRTACTPRHQRQRILRRICIITTRWSLASVDVLDLMNRPLQLL